MRFKLALLYQVHDAGHAGQREGAISDKRNGGMKFQPRIGDDANGARRIDRRKQSKQLQHQNKRRSERTHERQSIGRSDDQIDQCYRPGEKDQDFEKVSNRASTKRMAAQTEKCSLKE